MPHPRNPGDLVSLNDLFSDVQLDETNFHAYQSETLNFALENPFSYIILPMGEGKTGTMLRLLDLVMRDFDPAGVQHSLIVAPLRVAANTWPREIRKWRFAAGWPYTLIRAEDDDPEVLEAYARRYRQLRDFNVPTIEAQRGARFEMTETKQAIRDRLRKEVRSLTIINKEAVPWLVRAWGKKWPYDALVVDEATGLQDAGSEFTKAVNFVAPRFKRVHHLTATPAVQSLMPFFSMTYSLDQGARFGTAITHFRTRYFTQNFYTRQWDARPDAKQEIMEKIADIAFVRYDERREEDKPLVLRRPLRMTDEEYARYEEFEEEAIFTTAEGHEIEAVNAASLAQKLLQLGSGTIYDHQLEKIGETDDGNEVLRKVRSTHILHRHKIEDLKQLVEETEGQPTLVAYWSNASKAMLRAVFPSAKVLDRKASQEKAWNKGKIPMLLVHPQGAAHGLNLQDGGHNLYTYDMFHAGELWKQLIGRLDRQGQKFRVKVHVPLMARTLDEDVFAKQMALEADNRDLLARLRALTRAARDRRRARVGSH